MNMIDVINGRQHKGMSDDQMENEFGAQKRLARAIQEMREAVEMVNYQSAVVKIDLDAWNGFVHDEIPDEKSWDEKISLARCE